MSYTAIETKTKPQGTKWFGSVEPDTALRADAIPNSMTGFITVDKVKTGNSVVRTYVFDTKANFTAYLSARSSNADEIARQNYNTANGIVTTLEQ